MHLQYTCLHSLCQLDVPVEVLMHFTEQLHTIRLDNLTHACKQVPYVRLLQGAHISNNCRSSLVKLLVNKRHPYKELAKFDQIANFVELCASASVPVGATSIHTYRQNNDLRQAAVLW